MILMQGLCHSPFKHGKSLTPPGNATLASPPSSEDKCFASNTRTTSPMSTILRVVHWLSHRRKHSKESKANCCPDNVNVSFRFPPNVHGTPLSSDLYNQHKERKTLSPTSYCRSSFRKLKNIARGAHKKSVHLNNPVNSTVDTISRTTCITNSCSSPARYLHSSLVVSSLDDEQFDQPHTLDHEPGNQEQFFRFPFKGIIRSEEPTKFVKHSALAKARTLSIETKKAVCERLCATWPQSTTVISSIDDFLPEKEDYEKCYNPARVQEFELELNIEDAIKEWSIPYKDLSFKEALRTGQYGKIYKGHWHGDVLIYTYENCQDENEVNGFWETIAQLCMIRHENIVLFMGACVDKPHLAVITSMRKGPTLFEHLHVKHQIISPPNRINIARQIAQAMGYLHARGIIHKRLSSNNIILESKVKISLMDQGSVTYNYNGTDYGLITRGHLTYLSPQLMRCIQVEPPYVRYENRETAESDVYAFGTILFELMTGKFPYHRLHTHAIVWLIGNGQHDSVIHVNGSNVMRSLIASCWAPLAGQRPPFSHIVKQLQENISLNKEHSCSEPERLNKIGFC